MKLIKNVNIAHLSLRKREDLLFFMMREIKAGVDLDSSIKTWNSLAKSVNDHISYKD